MPNNKQWTKTVLRSVAWRLYEVGYYSLADYTKFCQKNKILVF